ncbi:MAG: glycosyltransferase family 2 protein [Lachnospiraceae bacterium]
MSQNLVSVILPAYNAERSLERAVTSVLSQTWQNWELILVNDGSADGTLALAERLARRDSRIRVIDMKNGGVSRARNAGLLAASGEEITFLDADDAMAPEMIETLEKVLQETGADFAGCGFSDAAHQGSGTGQVTLLSGEEILKKGILHSDTRVWSKLFRKNALEGVQFPGDLTIGEDMLFLLELLTDSTRYAVLDRALYLYEENPEGAMERPFVPTYFDQITCWDRAGERIQSRFPKALSDPAVSARLAAIQAVSAMLTAGKLAKLSAAKRRGYADKIRWMRHYVRTRWENRDARAQLPSGYPLKIRLFLLAPGLYFFLMSKR